MASSSSGAGPKRISRRQFVTEAAAASAAFGLLGEPAAARKRRQRRLGATKVVILGGGMGGLTAAHELAERGFAVTVVEPKALGGKARSIPVAGTGAGGRADLPGEHGFRFFPGFYKNIPDTMRRIPVAGNANGALDNLVDASQELLIFDRSDRFYTPPTPNTILQDYYSDKDNGIIQAARTVTTMMGIGSRVPMNEIDYFFEMLAVFLTSSDERRRGQWEYVSWWDYVNASNFSPAYQRTFGQGITKTLVAANGRKASARTIGLMAEAFVYAVVGEFVPVVQLESGYGAADRLLNAPTNEAWIDPWVAHLKSLGVQFTSGRATGLQMRQGRVSGVSLAGGRALDADWFVCAMPVEQILPLLSSAVLRADPSLGRLRRLETDWMNGIQFFLNRPPGLVVKGHAALLESAWSLTSIDQGLFWKNKIADRYGDGRVNDILSVDVSDFFSPGILYGKAAADCTPDEIASEVWAQLKVGFNGYDETVLSDDMLVRWFLDPAISYPNGATSRAANSEPLLINTTGSLDDRPEARTGIPNLFLASDYVRTNIDLATMEGANDAGRQAANAIAHDAGSLAPPASRGTLYQPAALAPARAVDAQRYAAGQPNLLQPS
jgi:uncharacterized protein with NAD-binding domain and iron-sulfur cluster